MDNKKSNWVLYSFLGGSLLGAGLGLLFAPKPGKEIREDIKNYTARTRDRISKSISEGVDIFEKSKHAVARAIDAGTAAYTEEGDRHIKAA